MGNTRKLKRTQQRNQQRKSARSAPPPSAAVASRPWKRYLAVGAVAVVVGLVIVLVASDLSSNPQGVADAPEGTEFFTVASAQHVNGTVQYAQDPPAGGPHAPPPALACRVYDTPVVNENAVHALEHGAVWITYQPNLSSDDIDTLEDFARRREVLVSPYPGLDSAVVATTWGRQLRVDSADDNRIDQFIRAFQNQTAPENAASC